MTRKSQAVGAQLDELRELACLAHTIPGVTLRVICQAGNELLVSYACLGADLDPCQLRAALLADDAHTPGRLAAGITQIEIVAGVASLGGGLYQRTHPGAASERWFVTTLATNAVQELVQGFPDTGGLRAVIKPDPELGVNAVCVGADRDTSASVLDELAVAILGAVLVDELAASLAASS